VICKVSTRLVTHMVGSNHNQSADRHQREETQPKARDGQKRLLTLNEAGVYIGLSHWRVRSLIYSGLPYVRLGRRILIDLKDLDALIDSNKQRECIRHNRREV
jgi:hypothetical protein